MTEQQKAAVERAAIAEYGTHPNLYGGQRDGFRKGAQTILENPVEWGLWKQYDVVKHVNEVANEAAKVGRELAERELHSQLTKYREALEWYSNIENYLEGDRPMISKFGVNADITSIAKEALKQQ